MDNREAYGENRQVSRLCSSERFAAPGECGRACTLKLKTIDYGLEWRSAVLARHQASCELWNG